MCKRVTDHCKGTKKIRMKNKLKRVTDFDKGVTVQNGKASVWNGYSLR